MKTKPNDHVNPSNAFIMTPITKREHFAALAMQGLAANPETIDWLAIQIAKEAVVQADALIDDLNKDNDE